MNQLLLKYRDNYDYNSILKDINLPLNLYLISSLIYHNNIIDPLTLMKNITLKEASYIIYPDENDMQDFKDITLFIKTMRRGDLNIVFPLNEFYYIGIGANPFRIYNKHTAIFYMLLTDIDIDLIFLFHRYEPILSSIENLLREIILSNMDIPNNVNHFLRYYNNCMDYVLNISENVKINIPDFNIVDKLNMAPILSLFIEDGGIVGPN